MSPIQVNKGKKAEARQISVFGSGEAMECDTEYNIENDSFVCITQGNSLRVDDSESFAINTYYSEQFFSEVVSLELENGKSPALLGELRSRDHVLISPNTWKRAENYCVDNNRNNYWADLDASPRASVSERSVNSPNSCLYRRQLDTSPRYNDVEVEQETVNTPTTRYIPILDQTGSEGSLDWNPADLDSSARNPFGEVVQPVQPLDDEENSKNESLTDTTEDTADELATTSPRLEVVVEEITEQVVVGRAIGRKSPQNYGRKSPKNYRKHINLKNKEARRLQREKRERQKEEEFEKKGWTPKISKEIQRYMHSTDLLIPKRSFQRLVKEIITKERNSYRCQTAAIAVLQEASEVFLTELFEYTNNAASHARRVTIMPKDLHLTKRIKK